MGLGRVGRGQEVRYLLDTDTCSYLARQDKRPWAKFQTVIYSQGWAISALTEHELRKGILSKGQGPWCQNVYEFLDLAQVAPFDGDAAMHSSQVSDHLRKLGKVSGTIDELIAGQAISLGATLVTNNTRHFEIVPNLRVENWA
jgi:tRNA(fMet)-specific endonuclease VapC